MLFTPFILLTLAVSSFAAPICKGKDRRTTAKTTTAKTTTAKTTTAKTTTSKTTSISTIAPAGWPFDAGEDGKAFGISQKLQTSTSSVGTEDDAPALIAQYPKGSYAGADIAGFIVEATGGSDADLDNAQEALLHYQVKFPPNFDFVKAGKLPGFYGGDNAAVAKTCAGGNHDDRCWSGRLMWRTDGAGELYAYLPTANKDLKICKGECDNKFGASIDRGAWTFPTGEWTNITQRVRLNDVGQSNGQIEIFVNGESKVNVDGLTLATSDASRIRGAMVHTFFGGSSSPDFASTKDQQAFFRNFKIETTQQLSSSKQ